MSRKRFGRKDRDTKCTWSPADRACWHIARISELCNEVRKLRRSWQHALTQCKYLELIVRNQRTTLQQQQERDALRRQAIVEKDQQILLLEELAVAGNDGGTRFYYRDLCRTQQDQLKEKDETIDGLRCDLEQEESAKNEVTGAYERAKRELDAAERRINDLENDVRSVERERDRAVDECQRQSNVIDDLNQQLRDAERRADLYGGF